MKKLAASACLIIALTQSAIAAERACRVSRSSFVFGSDTSWTMDVFGADKCIVNMPVRGSSAFENLELVRAPKSGTVQVTSKSSFFYIKKNFNNASDEFAMRVTGRGAQTSGQSTITILVKLK